MAVIVRFRSRASRYTITDLLGLTALCGFADLANFQQAHCQWVEQSLENGSGLRDDRWSESIAAGSLAFVERVKSQLGVKALHREFEQLGGAYAQREWSDAYGSEFIRENDVLRIENTIFWDENAETGDIAWSVRAVN